MKQVMPKRILHKTTLIFSYQLPKIYLHFQIKKVFNEIWNIWL